MRDEMIRNRIWNDILSLEKVILMDSLRFNSLWSWNFPTDMLSKIIFFKGQGDPILPYLEPVMSPKIINKLGVMSHF